MIDAVARHRLTTWDAHPKGRADFQRTRMLTDEEQAAVSSHFRWANAPKEQRWWVQEWSYDRGATWWASWSF